MPSDMQGKYHTFRMVLGCCLGLLAIGQEASGAFVAQLNSVSKNGGSYVIVKVENTDGDNKFGPISVIAGQLNWTATTSVDGITGPGNTFGTFCIEIPQHVHLSSSYTFDSKPLGELPTTRNPKMGDLKAAQLQALWASSFADASTSAIKLAAFQTAIWETVYENSTNYGVASGNFLAKNNDAVTSQADIYLASINGSQLVGGVLKSSSGNTLARANVVGFKVTKGTTDAQDQITEDDSNTTFATPAPASLVLALTGIIPLGLLRRFRKSAV